MGIRFAVGKITVRPWYGVVEGFGEGLCTLWFIMNRICALKRGKANCLAQVGFQNSYHRN
jgi:hypothetical protein